jgi:3-methyladenine DNA glycosylase/8-oxoguanine DNA glycosylase
VDDGWRANHPATRAAAHRMADEAIIERLTAVRAISRLTAEMLLILCLGRQGQSGSARIRRAAHG